MYPQTLDQAGAIIGLTLELGFSRIVVFTVRHKNKKLADKLEDMATLQTIKFRAITLLHDKVQAYEILHIFKELLALNQSGSCVIVLDCIPGLVSLVLETAHSLSIPDSSFVWVVLRDTVTSNDAFPPNVLGLRVSHDKFSLLYDAITLIARSVNNKGFSDGCLNESLTCFNNNTNWIKGDRLYRVFKNQTFTGKTGLIQFDELGCRTQSEIEIDQLHINEEGLKHWENIGSFNGTHVHLQSNFWIRESNLTSPNVIRMVTIEEEPILIVGQDDMEETDKCVLSEPCFKYVAGSRNDTRNTTKRLVKHCCSGFVIDVLNMLQKDLSFQAQIYLVEDNKYGVYDAEAGSWNGMINDLVEDKADLALATLTISEIRTRAVDFSSAFLHGETKIMLSSKVNEASGIIQFNFLFTFDSSLWLVILLLVNVILILVWCLDRFSPFGHCKTQTRRKRFVFDIPACMSFVWSTVYKIQLDDVTPRSTSARLVSTVFAFGTLILTTSYTANLAANLVNTQAHLPVNNIRDPEFTDAALGFKFATLGSSNTEMTFTRSSDPEYQKIATNMKPFSVSSYSEAIDKLDTGELDAFIEDSPFLDFAASKKHRCSLRIVGRAISMNGYGLALRKNSKWTKPITQLFLKYGRRDFFRKLRNKWFTGTCLNSPSVSNGHKSMVLQNFSGLFVVCAVAAGISILLLLAELLFKYCTRKWLVTYSLRTGASVRDLF